MNGGAFYNEIDPYAAEWLENLVSAGHIAPGRVDRRSIADLTPADVAGPGQRHFVDLTRRTRPPTRHGRKLLELLADLLDKPDLPASPTPEKDGGP